MTFRRDELENLINEKNSLSSGAKLHWFHWAVLVSSIILTIGIWYYAKGQIQAQTETRFNRKADRVVRLISERMAKYEDALWSGVAMIDARGGDIGHKDWLTYSNRLQIGTKYPGINGIGVIHYLPNKDVLQKYLESKKAERPGYRIYPAHNNKEFLPITYIEPVKTNKAAVGLDMAHETNRYTAALRARDTGAAQITGPIILVQDKEKTPGFLFYAPFYKGGRYETIAERRQNFSGLVYAPFVVKKLMAGTLDRANRQVGIKITDNGQVLYDELKPGTTDYDPNPMYVKTVKVDGYGREFRFEIHSSKSFRQANVSSQPTFILLAGLIIEALILMLFIFLAKANRRAVQLVDRVTSEYRTQLEDMELSKHQAEESNKLKSSFLATMSHEIRTPLNGIMGMGQLLQREAEGDYQKKLVNSIVTSGELLLSIIEGILDISKIESGLIKPDLDIFQIDELCEEVIDSFYAPAKNKNVELITNIETNHNHYLGDINILKQILINIIGNAIKFTDEGNVTLTVSNISSGRVKFSITDTGIGIDEQYQETIFERFRQVEYQNTRKYGGTGLGLSITRDLVGLLNGTISVSSTLGEGAEFTVVVPLPVRNEPDELEDTPTIVAEKVSDKRSDEKLKVLLAEDSEINQDLILEALKPENGYEVVIANDGIEVLEKLEEQEFDLILMDVQMPRMTGDEAIRKIRGSEAGYANIPIIVLTANAMRGAEELYLMDGANAYLTKPIDLDVLQNTITEILKVEQVESVA